MRQPGNEPSLGREVAGTLTGYVSGQIKISVILALLYSIGYAIAGVPLWFLIGVVSGGLNFIPFVGPVIGLLLAELAVFLGSGTLYNYLGVLIVYVIVQGVEGFYLTPKILGRRVGLSPLMVFLCILIGGAFFGPLGVLLAVPVAAIAAVLWKRFRRN
jgi:predicted PurR-regulated permease PerM